ncbi:unnamed protein product [Moneuplotes crassus]|uniref:Uncharacterized protein n=1 Tax=Euplotes crassus TaxID=5936 RepID=A0AAD1Y2P5_EUPCR|nr:unnamed protein product [Moneuplotes crassus]
MNSRALKEILSYSCGRKPHASVFSLLVRSPYFYKYGASLPLASLFTTKGILSEILSS